MDNNSITIGIKSLGTNPPDFSIHKAVHFAGDLFDFRGEIQSLPSERGLNYRISATARF